MDLSTKMMPQPLHIDGFLCRLGQSFELNAEALQNDGNVCEIISGLLNKHNHLNN
jgi:hypothetical protein